MIVSISEIFVSVYCIVCYRYVYRWVESISIDKGTMAADPYILHWYNVQPNFHLDKELLHELEFSIYLVEAIDDEGKVYTFTLLLMEIKKLHQYGLIPPHHCHQTGIDRFFALQPCGIDVKKAVQLLKTLQEDGRYIVQNDQGQDIPLKLSARLIVDALHIS